MAKCIKIRTKKRQVCIGDLNRLIKLQNRDITPPLFGVSQFNETFTDISDTWAGIETVSGKTYFDGAGTETNITHYFYIRYDTSVNSETWIEYDGRRFDILNTEDYDERKEFMRLVCVDRGLTNKPASKA